MSIENGLYNRALRSGVGLSQTLSNVFYFTIPWHPQSYIDQITLTNYIANDSTVNSIVLLDTGAHYRFNSTDSKAHVIYRDTTDKALTTAETMAVNWSFNPPIYHENLYNRPYLNVAIVLTSAVLIKPYITAFGKKANAETYTKTDSTSIGDFKDYRVLIGKNQSGSNGTGGQIYDVTGLAKGNGGENASLFNFSNANDYIYIGSKTPIDHWDFQIGTGATWLTTLTGQYWNTAGAGWSTFTVVDDTSSGNGDSMKYSGVVEAVGIGQSTTWGPVVFRNSDNAQLPQDPLTTLQDAIRNGTTQPVNIADNSPRYWVRFKLSSTPIPLTINKILPVLEAYEPVF